MTILGTLNWISFIDDIVKRYNNTVHSVTKLKPIEIKTRKQEQVLLRTVYKKINIFKIPKFKVNQPVRISKYRTIFSKSFYENYTFEVFYIEKIKIGDPNTYHLRDFKFEPIAGVFYEEELVPVLYPEYFVIEKTMKTKDPTKIKVFWRGYKEPTIENKKDFSEI